MKINLIVAVAENGVIGDGEKLLWHLPNDLRRFKELTKNNIIIMGRGTWDSLPLKPLPNRTNVIVTSSPDTVAIGYPDVHKIDTIAPFINYSKMMSSRIDCEVFIIGGGSVYRQAVWGKFVDRMYVTRVHAKIEGSVTFPEIPEEFELVQSDFNHKDDLHEYDYTFEIWELRKF